jgi:hypothetical protein
MLVLEETRVKFVCLCFRASLLVGVRMLCTFVHFQLSSTSQQAVNSYQTKSAVHPVFGMLR